MGRGAMIACAVAATVGAKAPASAQEIRTPRTQINFRAETLARTELLIDASPSKIWTLLTDADRWSEWMPELGTTRINGPLLPSSVIHWEPQGQVVESRLVVVQPSRRLIWNGTDGAVHVWELIPRRKRTLLRNSESIDHWQMPEARAKGSAILTATLKMWNARIAETLAKRKGQSRT